MKILFATDGSPGSEIALDLLLSLRYRPTDRIDVVSVPVHSYVGASVDGFGAFVTEVIEVETAAARRTAAQAVARIHARGITTGIRIVEGLPTEAIISTAVAAKDDLIVVGSRGRGRIAGAILGSTARALARHSPIPVLVVRERREAPLRILVASDGSPDSDAAVAALGSFPLPRNAEVAVLYVARDVAQATWPPGAFGDELRAAVERDERQAALEALRVVAARLPSGVQAHLEIEHGPVADRVLGHAGAMGADLIVLGSRGSNRGELFIQGSTADRVLAGAHCAVLVARAMDREAVAAADSGSPEPAAAMR
jgi:nucleotide-binding universal stress UspA family protein